ncbi:MAG: bifunctional glutamate N-acetyltransferase/amino-acid acetyltransferase ArgJ [bacterium]
MAVNLSAPETDQLLPVSGIRLAACAAGIRYANRNDLVLLELAEGTTSAAVFTKNAFCAAPVVLCREHLAQTAPRYLLINSGNANAGTGDQGMQVARQTCAWVAELASCEPSAVLPFSTGVIGEPLPLAPFEKTLPTAFANLAEDQWLAAAQGIMTTDTVAKAVSKQVEINGKTVTITGMSKGSGMIKPDMATMLAYVACDAEIDQARLQRLLQQGTDDSFNAITVDGDTSTNDALVLMATGQSGAVIDDQCEADFYAAFLDVLQYLAHAIIRDGEGATKFVSIVVEQAQDREEARTVAYTVAHSPLVKTALFASDPNWGRLLMAIGRSPIEALDVQKISLFLGKTPLLVDGLPAADYTEAKGQAEMDQTEITIRIQLGRGQAEATVWTSDLSYDYVKINAEYRS